MIPKGVLNIPYPYMIFANMQMLGLSSVKNVVKVGDTISDIREGVQEGVQAGVWTVGVVEGSSQLGLSQQLSTEVQEDVCRKAEIGFRQAGAQFVIRNLSQLPALIQALGMEKH